MEQDSIGIKPANRKKYLIIAASAVAVILIAALIAWLLWPKTENNQNGTSSNTTNEAEKTFYSTLENAAKQQKLRVGMYRETFANKADAEARQNIGSIASSVSEVDVAAGKYRSVSAHNLVEEDKTFSIERCIDGTTYREVYDQPPAQNTKRATNLREASAQLKLLPEGNLFKLTQPLVFISCPHLGLLPSAPPLAVARLSDGVFPVTLSEAQAQDWATKLKAANLFEIKDEGTVERDGQRLKKISFRPTSESGVNSQLYNIFYESGEIDKIKAEHPDAKWEFEFQGINPLNTGSVGGFYLINELTNLPVYSELYGTNPDRKTNESRSASRNIARTKQTYVFAEQLSLTLETPLEFLE